MAKKLSFNEISDFFEEETKELQRELEEEYRACNKQLIFEFADIVPEDTNLVCVIWVDGPRNIRHSKRIKFQNNTSPSLNGGEMIPVTISDNPQIPDSVRTKLKIKEKELTRIKKWVVLNKNVLLDYSNGNITTRQLYQLLQPLND